MIFVVATSFCHAAANPKKYPCQQNDSKAIVVAIIDYLKTNSVVPLDDTAIISAQCVKNYASASVHSKKQVTDDATVYLHKVKNKWEVMSLGTFFDEKFLSQLPIELRAAGN